LYSYGLAKTIAMVRESRVDICSTDKTSVATMSFYVVAAG
jgi:hypothetical protein